MDFPADESEPSLALIAQLSELSSPYTIINAIAFVVLVFSSALISGSEVAFFSIDDNKLKDLKEEDSTISRAMLYLLGRKRYLLATILIMNNLINIAIVTLSTFFTWSLLGTKTTEGKIVVTLSAIVTFVILFFGEVVPKNFC